MQFAVIDIETTGLNPISDRVLEIGIVRIDENQVVSSYTRLINPGRTVPSSITSLTGITTKMVKDSPLFEELAVQINEMTAGCVLVGHHVQFDYSFLKNEMRNAGISFSRKTICTAELSRILFSGKKSHSLKSVCRYFEIENSQPHRALPDASATAKVFLQLVKKLGEPFVVSLLKHRHDNLAISLDMINKKVKQLPNTTGVYYFIGKDNKPIYIGKAKRIRSRVQSHFRGEGNSVQLLAVTPMIKDIRFFETGSEVLAALQEDHEIRHYWPVYNRAQKVSNKRFGVVIYTDMKNRWRMGIAAYGKSHCFQIFFHQYHLAVDYIRDHVNRYGLKAEYCGIGVVSEIEVSDAAHNTGFEKMLMDSANRDQTEFIYTSGRTKEELGFIFMENGTYKGFGFIQKGYKISRQLAEQNLIPRYSSVTVENILKKLRKINFPQPLPDAEETSSMNFISH